LLGVDLYSNIAAKPIDVDSNILSYLAVLFLFQFYPICS